LQVASIRLFPDFAAAVASARLTAGGYAREGHYVVICPKQGLLTLEPESPEWFAWLATLSSFRFVGNQGRLTAHRELERVPRGAWRAHRNIRNHTYNLRLGSTQSLTIAALEQAAADLQAHLK